MMTGELVGPFPDYLSAEFFAKALASDHNVQAREINIDALRLSAGSKAGDNYTSEIFRAVVDYRLSGAAQQTVSLIIKAMPPVDRRVPVQELAVYEKEVHMYTDTLPRMSKLLNGKQLSAKCIYAEQEPFPIIVFEDLCAKGFKMADRTHGIDVDHCTLVLDTLGQFHAASMVLAEQDARSMDMYGFGMIKPGNKRSPQLNKLLMAGIEVAANLARTLPGSESKAIQLTSLLDNYFVKLEHHCNFTPCDYKVLNHGDAWTNNYLFKYDATTGRPIDLIFIDYQLSFYSSPGMDLNYFLSLSPDSETRESNRNQLIETYHTSFTSALRMLGSPMAREFPLERITNAIRSRAVFGLMATASMLPIVSKAADTSGLEKIYDNPFYLRALTNCLAQFDGSLLEELEASMA